VFVESAGAGAGSRFGFVLPAGPAGSSRPTAAA
jgi:hypothetical protein